MLGPIVMACDQTYAMQLATALCSLVEANVASWPLDIHVLVAAFPADVQKKVLASLPAGSATIRWIPADMSIFRDFYTPTSTSKINYARLLIPEIFPDAVSRVLYLDADLLVLSDLTSLWETDLGDCVLGGVLDNLDSAIKKNKPGLERAPRVESYFNAGVMLIDLAKWRQHHIQQKALMYLKNYPAPLYSDQDALNVACDRMWKKLEKRWNFIDAHDEVDISSLTPTQKPAIIHFATWNRPWNYAYPNINASIYDDFRSRTLFGRTRLQKQHDTWRRGWTESKRWLKGHLRANTVLAQSGD